jgi:MFS family permease
MVLSVMMTSLCKEYYQFMLAQGIMGGIASGMLFAPVMTCVSHYFHDRRSAALGVTVSGSSIGGLIFPRMNL